MRKRKYPIQVYLSEKENDKFRKLVKKSGLSSAAYIRHLINGYVPNDAPPPDYFSMMRELHAVGVNLNQIAAKSHSLGFIDCPQYDKAYNQFQEIIKQITVTVILPRRME